MMFGRADKEFMMIDTTDKHIGLRVKHYRKLQQLTKAQFAEKANMSLSWLNTIEKGQANIKIPTLRKLTSAANVHATSLVSDRPTVAEFFKFVDWGMPGWILKCFEKLEREANSANEYWLEYMGTKHPAMGDLMLQIMQLAFKAERL